MDLSGKLVRKLAIIEGGLTPEQAQRIAEIGEAQGIIGGQLWKSWEEFIQAHEEHND